MLVYRAFRYEPELNNKQRTLLKKAAGVARFAYNWGLEDRIRRYHVNEGSARFTSWVVQNRNLNKLKMTSFPWMSEVSSCIPTQALRDLDQAFRNFRNRRDNARKEGHRIEIGFPRFKRKSSARDSFRLVGWIRCYAEAIQLPRLGRLRTKERVSMKGHILSATISREADRWFVSLQVEEEMRNPSRPTGLPIGIDFGIKRLATLSDGTITENPRPLRIRIRKLQRLSREHGRKMQGSNNRRKLALRLAGLHRRIRNILRDAQHKFTTMLAKNHGLVATESLNVMGMMGNRYIAAAIGDAGWGTALGMLRYKTRWYGSEHFQAPRLYPSTRLCSRCGFLSLELRLSQRLFGCQACGLQMDRDLNAARNLVALSLRETLNACERREVHDDSQKGSGQVPIGEAGTERCPHTAVQSRRTERSCLPIQLGGCRF